jgi:branched-chain amino acid transport system substrate-binding protein
MSFQNLKGLRSGQTRRQVLKNASMALSGAAAFTMAPAILRAQARTIIIGLVTPTTGPLAVFAEPDAFVLGEFRMAVAGGIKIGAQTHPVEVIVKDSQSNSNRAAEAASELILRNKVDLMVVAHTPDTVNPVADQCEINESRASPPTCPGNPISSAGAAIRRRASSGPIISSGAPSN